MKSWPCGWLILACLGISCLAGRCLAQPQLPDDKKELIKQLPVPQALNLEALFKKIDQQKLEAAWAALKKHGITRLTPTSRKPQISSVLSCLLKQKANCKA
jgi:hypothetical protein